MTTPGPAAPDERAETHGRPTPGVRHSDIRTAVALAVVVLAIAVLPLGKTLLAPLAPDFPALDTDVAARLRYRLAALTLATGVVAAVAWLVPGSLRFLRVGGLGWARFLHVLQDVVIFGAPFAAAP